MPVSFKTLFQGGFLVHYTKDEDLAPAQQTDLLAAVRQVGRFQPTGIVFLLSQGVWKVDPAIPKYWLEVTADSQLKMAAMAIVSPSLAVRSAALAFGVANTLRRHPMAVQAFTDEQKAVRWLEDELVGARKAASTSRSGMKR
jgi:hypothetical protein